VSFDKCKFTFYKSNEAAMIESFRHKGLRRLYEDDDRNKLPPDMVEPNPRDYFRAR